MYDALATCVEGKLLKELYLHIKRSLIIAEQGGALSRVTGLEVIDAKATGAPKGTAGTVYECPGNYRPKRNIGDMCMCAPVSIGPD